MQCIGRTKASARCKNKQRSLFCKKHRFQPYYLLFMVLTILGLFAGLYQDLWREIWSSSANLNNEKDPASNVVEISPSETTEFPEIIDTQVRGIIADLHNRHHAKSTILLIQDLQKDHPYVISHVEEDNPLIIFEPGHLLTPIIYAIALQNGSLEPSTMIDCHDGYYRDKKVWVRDPIINKELLASDVIKKNSYIGIYKIALKCGKNHIVNGINKFFPNIDVTFYLDDLNFSKLSFGYCISITPAQLLKAYCIIATNKTDDNAAYHLSKGVKLNTRRAMLTATEDTGTARKIRVDDILIAANTGSSIVYDHQFKRFDRNYLDAGCVAIFPSSFPRYVIVLIVRAKHTDNSPAYGGIISAPQIKKIATILRDY